MTVEELPTYLRETLAAISRAAARGDVPAAAGASGSEIPKRGGGVRKLGIPTVLDRFIQQAMLQVLQPLIRPDASPSTATAFGRDAARTTRSCAAQRYIQAGRRWVVDVDLEKFFDRVNHDVLMERLAKRIADRRLLGLIRRYLEAGIMANGVVMERHEGTPQGGPLSPLLANVLLDEVDKELERRGHAFVRYADDCNVYVRSKRAGERVMAALRRALRASSGSGSTRRRARWRGRGTASSRLQLLGGTGTDGQTPRRARSPGNDEGRVRQITGRNAGTEPGPGRRRNCGATCRAGRPTSGSPRLPASFASWTSGSATACERCSSNSGNAAQRSTANCAPAECPCAPLRKWRPTSGAGGATRHTAHQHRSAQQLLRRARRSPARRVTSTLRTAGCGPACPVVWEGMPGFPGRPYPDSCATAFG